MTLQRLLRAKPGTLTVTLLDGSGDPVAATGAVTVAVVSVSGQVIFAAGTAAAPAAGLGTGGYQLAVTAAQVPQLDVWSAVWTDAGTGATETTGHEICGGFHFSIAEARASDDSLTDAGRYPDALILAKRQAVEDEVEYICDVAFVPRYRRVLLDGTATPDLYLPDSRLRVLRSVTITASGQAPLTLAPSALAALNAQLAGGAGDDDLLLQRNDFGIWDEGRRNIAIEYECGHDTPPAPLKDAELLRLRYALNRRYSGVADRASSFVTEGGTTYRLDAADAFKTGINDIDAVYGRYSTRNVGDKTTPVSRSVDTDPSWYSIYHGGRR